MPTTFIPDYRVLLLVKIAQKSYIPSIINTGETVDFIEKSDLVVV